MCAAYKGRVVAVTLLLAAQGIAVNAVANVRAGAVASGLPYDAAPAVLSEPP